MVTIARRRTIDSRDAIIWAALDEIADPEIPTISVVELGVIRGFAFEPGQNGGERLTVELLPTFIGCPAIEIMREQVGERLRSLEVADHVEVEVSFAEPWTSDRISPAGREKLRASGFAPPTPIALAAPSVNPADLLTMLEIAICPYCGSRKTTLDNPFGPTLCRAIYHCDACHQPFEQFKTV
jgi:ring-1,2-phenylacetyl-CoA epoxidase subunit PaaD